MSPDRELVRALCAGQEGSEEEFVERYRGLTIGLSAGRFQLSPEEGEAIFQDLVARLWSDNFKALRSWRGEGKLSTYLTVIVTRMCLERRRLAERTTPLDEAREPEAEQPSAESLAVERQQAAAARAALALLRPRDRLLLVLRFVDERTPSEIAPLLGLSPGTCRKALHDALGRLRRRLQDQAPDLFDG